MCFFPKLPFCYRASEVPSDVEVYKLNEQAGFSLSEQEPAFTFVYDWVHNRFCSLSTGVKKVLGYERNMILNNYPLVFSELSRSEDRIYLKAMLSRCEEFLSLLTYDQRSSIQIHMLYAVMRPDGKFVSLLQKHKGLVFNRSGKLVYSYGTCEDLSHYNPDTQFHLTIFASHLSSPFTFKPREGTDSLDFNLTPSEIKILKLHSEGCKSQEIADKLCISVNTVNTHRRNMLGKTGVGNTAQLVAYALRRGMI